MFIIFILNLFNVTIFITTLFHFFAPFLNHRLKIFSRWQYKPPLKLRWNQPLRFFILILFSVTTRMEIDQIKVSVIGCHLGGGRGDTCMLGKVFFYQVLPTYIWLIKNNHCFQKVHNGIFSSLSFLYVLYRGEPLPKLEWVRMAGEEKVESKSSPSFFQSSFSLCQELFMLPCAAREPSVMFGFFTQPTDVSTTNLLT